MRRVIKTISLFAIFSVCTLPLQGMTLEEALKLSLQNYPGLKAEYEDLEIGAARIDFARSGYRPTVSMTGQLGKLRYYDSLTDTTRKLYPKFVGGAVIQPIFRGGRTVSAVSRTKHAYAAEVYNYGEEVDLLILQVAVAYIDVLREYEILKTNENNQSYLAREHKAVDDRFSVGDVTQTDISQSKARLVGADARVAESLGRVDGVRAVLEKFVGQPVDGVIDPNLPLEIPSSLEAFIKKVLQSNRLLKAQEEIYRAAVQAYYEVKGELYPEVNLEGRLQQTKDFVVSGEFVNEASAFLTINVPLYQAGRVQARMRETAALMRKEWELYRTLCLELRQRSIQAWEAREVELAQIDLFKAQVDANEVALEGVKKEESAGLRTVLDVLNAELELLNARVSFIDSRRNLFVAELEILHLLSRLYETFFCM